jgi:metallo-beta-lactamase family protein
VLPDAAHIQEEDAREANRHGFTKHQPALPLYTTADAARTLDRLQPVGYERPIPLLSRPGGDQVSSRSASGADQVAIRSRSDAPTVEFINAGHLLGSSYARVGWWEDDPLWWGPRPLRAARHAGPVTVCEADVLLLESTYGDRLHEVDDNGDRPANIVTDTARQGGKLIIPSFAIGRVEEVLYWLKRLEDEKRIPVLPVYVDSPMAIGALQFYSSRLTELDAEFSAGTDRGQTGSDPGVRPQGMKRVASFATRRFVTVSSPQQSADLVASRQPSIIISSSGMATGGRVLRHLAATISNPKNTVLFVGYQAAGTRGRLLTDGAKEIRLLGRVYPVAARVERIDSMSAHADAAEIMQWLSGFSGPPGMTYLVHGDPVALTALAAKIGAERQWPVHVAAHLERVELPA